MTNPDARSVDTGAASPDHGAKHATPDVAHSADDAAAIALLEEVGNLENLAREQNLEIPDSVNPNAEEISQFFRSSIEERIAATGDDPSNEKERAFLNSLLKNPNQDRKKWKNNQRKWFTRISDSTLRKSFLEKAQRTRTHLESVLVKPVDSAPTTDTNDTGPSRDKGKGNIFDGKSRDAIDAAWERVLKDLPADEAKAVRDARRAGSKVTDEQRALLRLYHDKLVFDTVTDAGSSTGGSPDAASPDANAGDAASVDTAPTPDTTAAGDTVDVPPIDTAATPEEQEKNARRLGELMKAYGTTTIRDPEGEYSRNYVQEMEEFALALKTGKGEFVTNRAKHGTDWEQIGALDQDLSFADVVALRSTLAQHLTRNIGERGINMATGKEEEITEQNFRLFDESPRGRFANASELFLLAQTKLNLEKAGVTDIKAEPANDAQREALSTFLNYRQKLYESASTTPWVKDAILKNDGLSENDLFEPVPWTPIIPGTRTPEANPAAPTEPAPEATPGTPATPEGPTTPEVPGTPAAERRATGILSRINEFIRTNTDALGRRMATGTGKGIGASARIGVSIMLGRVLGNWAAIPRLWSVKNYVQQRFALRGLSGKGGINESMAQALDARAQQRAARRERKETTAQLLAEAWSTSDPAKIQELIERLPAAPAPSTDVRDALRKYNEQLQSARGGEKVFQETGNGTEVHSTPERQLQAQLFRELSRDRDLTEAQRREVIQNFNDKYIDTKVTGMQAAKQSLNTALLITGSHFNIPAAMVGRLVTYGVFDVLAHKRRMEQEPMGNIMQQKANLLAESRAAAAAGNTELANQRKEEADTILLRTIRAGDIKVGGVAAFKDAFTGTFATLSGKKPNTTFLQKVGAAAKIATYLGLAFSAYEAEKIAENAQLGEQATKELIHNLERHVTAAHAPSEDAPDVGLDHATSTVVAAHAETPPVPEVAPQVETHAEYLGGKSVWAEATKQVESRFHANLEDAQKLGDPKILEGVRTFNVDRLKDVIAANPHAYGLPEHINLDRVTLEQLKGIQWDKAAHDAFGAEGFKVPSNAEILSIAQNNETAREFFAQHTDIPITGQNINEVMAGHGSALLEKMAQPAEIPNVEAALSMDHATLDNIVHPTDAEELAQMSLADQVSQNISHDVATALNGTLYDKDSIYQQLGLNSNDHADFATIVRHHQEALSEQSGTPVDATHAIHDLARENDPAKLEELKALATPEIGKAFVADTSRIQEAILHAEGASFLEQKYNAGNLKEFSVAVRTFMNDHNTENLTPTAALERMRALSESDAKAFVEAHGGASTWEKLAKHVETFHAGQADPEAVADATSTMENISGAEKAWREIPLSERSGAEHWEVMTDRFDVGPGVEFHADQYGVWQNVDVKMDSDLTLHVSYDGGSETIVAPEQKLMNMEWMKAQLADVGKSVQAKYDRFVSFTKVTPGGSVHKDDFLGKPIDATMDRTTRALDVKWGNDRYHIPRPEKVAEFRASAQ